MTSPSFETMLRMWIVAHHRDILGVMGGPTVVHFGIYGENFLITKNLMQLCTLMNIEANYSEEVFSGWRPQRASSGSSWGHKSYIWDPLERFDRRLFCSSPKSPKVFQNYVLGSLDNFWSLCWFLPNIYFPRRKNSPWTHLRLHISSQYHISSILYPRIL